MLSVGGAIRSAVAGAMVLPERWRRGVAYNPLSARTAQDPYPALRPCATGLRCTAAGAQVLGVHAPRRCGRHPARPSALRQRPAHGHAIVSTARHAAPAARVHAAVSGSSDHTRLRALVSNAFTPRAVSALEFRVRSILGGLLDDIDDPSAFDLMEAVARPLPVIVMAEMLGVPAEDRADSQCGRRSARVCWNPRSVGANVRLAERPPKLFDAYFRPIIEERRTARRRTSSAPLVRAQDEGEHLSERETLNMLRLLLSAGTETTANLIGNGVLALLRNPDQLQRLRDDPA